MTYSCDERPGFWWYATGDGKAYSVVVARSYNDLMKELGQWIAEGLKEAEDGGWEWGDYMLNEPTQIWLYSVNEEAAAPECGADVRKEAAERWVKFRNAAAYCEGIAETRGGQYVRSANRLELPEELCLDLDAWEWEWTVEEESLRIH